MANAKKSKKDATNEDDFENDDPTAKKAKEIGKEMGATEDKNPEEDDDEEFEIEVHDDDDIEDEKLAKNKAKDKADEKDGKDKKERRELSNREKRALRKKRINDKFGEKDAEIERLREENARITRRQDETDGRLHGINKAEIERAFNEAQQIFRSAEAASVTAFEANDGVQYTRLLQTMKEQDDRMKLLRDTYQKFEKPPEQKDDRATEANRPDPRTISQAKAWAKRNDWYDPDGSDEDSAIAKAIAGVLVKEGFDPKSEDYWDELDDRLDDRRNGKNTQADDDDEDDDEQPPARQQKRRASPPVGGGSQRSEVNGKRTIRLPTSYVEKMKREAPEIWNDPKRRKKLLEDRARILREAE